jgi:branched-chain amino acid transport system substrate-binding protein
MKAKKYFLILFILIFVFGCGKKEEVIKIGVSLPLTGDAAVWGLSQKDGYELALEKINKEGGFNGKKIELIYGDDKGLANEGVKVLRKFIDVDKIKILTGVANSSVALAYIPIITENKIIFVSSGASSPKLTGASPYFFRTWPSDIAEALAMARYAIKELKLKSISILYINNDYGIGLTQPFIQEFANLGGKIKVNESFEQSATDFRTQLSKIKSSKPNAIYLAGNPREMGRAIKQARELGINNLLLSISTLNDPEVFNIAGNKALKNVIITDASFDPNSKRPEVQEFLNDFRKKFNKEPGILANTAYDALNIISDAIKKVGDDPVKLTQYLKQMNAYLGVSGEIKFSSGGDIQRPIQIKKFIDNSFVKIIENYYWY